MEKPRVSGNKTSETAGRWLWHLSSVLEQSKATLKAWEAGFERPFDANILASLAPKMGHSVFLLREKGSGKRYMLLNWANGPLEVTVGSPEGRTVDIHQNDHDERVNVNRLELLPASRGDDNDKCPNWIRNLGVETGVDLLT